MKLLLFQFKNKTKNLNLYIGLNCGVYAIVLQNNMWNISSIHNVTNYNGVLNIANQNAFNNKKCIDSFVSFKPIKYFLQRYIAMELGIANDKLHAHDIRGL